MAKRIEQALHVPRNYEKFILKLTTELLKTYQYYSTTSLAPLRQARRHVPARCPLGIGRETWQKSQDHSKVRRRR